MQDPFDSAAAALRAGRLDEAERQFRRLLRDAPGHAGALNLLAQIRFRAGDMDETEALLRRAAAAEPGLADTQYNLGLVLRAKGRAADELAAYHAALKLNPRHANALANLAGALLDRTQPAQALDAADRALAAEPRHPIALNNRGTALWQLGRHGEAIQALRQAVAAAPDYAGAHRNLGQCLLDRGRTDEAIAAFRKAAELDPGDRAAADGLAEAMRDLLPSWHFPMLADAKRNLLYRRAIEAAVKPGMLVLDIGTGSGLLAMMAARAGAERVIACESEPRLAEIARQIVALNGFAGRIAVIARRSTDLKPGADLPRPADLVVSEVLDAGLIGEGVISTLRHALAELAAPGARLIPAAATVHGALIHAPALRLTNPVRRIDGFDLSPFDQFRGKSGSILAALETEEHRLLSEPAPLFEFDFARPVPAPRQRDVAFRATADGTVHAMAMWFDLALDQAHGGSTRPGGEFRHWATPLFFLERDVAVARGQDVTLRVGHDNTTWQVGLDAPRLGV
ncbi:MAG: tetratricopeptide repeat protein [Rhodospirillales bacterium]